jgi:hypothetical protein
MEKILNIEKLQSIIENPEYMNIDCDQHHFYIGTIKDQKVIVYAEKMADDKYSIVCADWLFTSENIKKLTTR